MSEEAFKYLETKDVYRFLEGDGESNLIEYNGEGYGLPYLTASDLLGYCQQFGLVEEVPGFSRWTYVEALIKAAVANDRCDELLNFFFDLSHFNNLQGSHGLDIPAIPDEDVENAFFRLHGITSGEFVNALSLTLPLSGRNVKSRKTKTTPPRSGGVTAYLPPVPRPPASGPGRPGTGG